MKRNFWKKTAAGLLALLIVSGNTPIKPVADLFGSIAITASAEGEKIISTCGENATWLLDLETGKLTISGTGAMYDYNYDDHPTWQEYIDSITSVEIASGITTIGSLAFNGCQNLTEVTIPYGVTSIGHSAFFDCVSLTEVTIPYGVTSIGSSAFHGCVSLTEVTIPDSVTSIGDEAFSYCENLQSVTIPSSVTSIESDAFYDCTGVTDVYCYAAPEKLTWNEYLYDDFIYDEDNPDVHGTTVCHVPAEYYDTYVSKFGGTVNVTFKEISKGKCGENVTWEYDRNTKTLTISGEGAMADYNNAEQTAPWYAFYKDITSVEIQSGVTSIGERAFSGCIELTSVTVKRTTPPALSDSVFDDTADNLKIFVPAASVDDYKSDENWSKYADKISTYELADGQYKQGAQKDDAYYTRFVFVVPKAQFAGKSKAKFTATYDGKDYTYETTSYYTGVISNGIEYTAASADSALFVVTISSGSFIYNDLTCTLDFE